MKGLLRINHNGSKWAGQKPDDVSLLCDRLKAHKLASFSTFERTGRERRYWGNFDDVSAGFSVDVTVSSAADKTLGNLFRSNWQRFRKTPSSR